MSAIPSVVFLTFAAIVITLFVVGEQRRKKRIQALASFAHSRGWAFHHQPQGLLATYPNSSPFGQGRKRSMRNLMVISWGNLRGQSFDYSYVTGSGKHSTTHHNHVVAVELPAPMPLLSLRPMGGMDSFGIFFGGQDIQFESAAFNKAWRVQGEHGPAAYDIIHPRMIDWLMHPAVAGLNFTVGGWYLYMYRAGRQQPGNVEPILNALLEFHRRIPAYVWQKARGQ